MLAQSDERDFGVDALLDRASSIRQEETGNWERTGPKSGLLPCELILPL